MPGDLVEGEPVAQQREDGALAIGERRPGAAQVAGGAPGVEGCDEGVLAAGAAVVRRDGDGGGTVYPDSAVVWMVAAGPGILTPDETEEIEGSAALSDVMGLVTRVAGLAELHESHAVAIGP